jgi:hypothetical protein
VLAHYVQRLYGKENYTLDEDYFLLVDTSPALPDIERANPFGNDTLTAEQKSWVGSIAMVISL